MRCGEVGRHRDDRRSEVDELEGDVVRDLSPCDRAGMRPRWRCAGDDGEPVHDGEIGPLTGGVMTSDVPVDHAAVRGSASVGLAAIASQRQHANA